MPWYVRTSADGDTHWSNKTPKEGVSEVDVRALCGVRFTKLMQTVGGHSATVVMLPALRGEPADREQMCPACAAKLEKAELRNTPNVTTD